MGIIILVAVLVASVPALKLEYYGYPLTMQPMPSRLPSYSGQVAGTRLTYGKVGLKLALRGCGDAGSVCRVYIGFRGEYMEIIKGLHTIDDTGFVNIYLLVEENGLTIIDTGMPGNAQKIVECAGTLGYKSTDIKTIVLTHADLDHSGSAKQLKELTGAEIAIGVLDAPRVEGKMELKAAKDLSSRVFGIVSKFGRFETFKPNLLLKEGDRVGSLSVIETPGHTDGSICLYGERAFMFVGDTLRGDDNGGVQPPSDTMTYDMQKVWESIKKLSHFECDIMLPGHGKPVMPDASKKVRELLQKHYS
jgi:glyoxylase-like metal-dependent hydrolase (beta-lactamase superfamily II)